MSRYTTTQQIKDKSGKRKAETTILPVVPISEDDIYIQVTSPERLDLLADKVFVSTLFIWMTFNFDNFVILISTILIVSREISISYLRLFMISRSKNMSEIKSDLLGKYKTTFQMIGLGFLLLSPLSSSILFSLSLGLVFFSALMSWYSFIRYLNKWIV